MKNLNNLDLLNVSGGASDNTQCDSFKKDLQDALQAGANKVGDGADSLADKINELLDKYK